LTPLAEALRDLRGLRNDQEVLQMAKAKPEEHRAVPKTRTRRRLQTLIAAAVNRSAGL